MIGPSSKRTAKTTMATKTRINAYSTRPCPRSFKENSTAITSFMDKEEALFSQGLFFKLIELSDARETIVDSAEDVADNRAE
jgi:hypothetical protein